MPPGEPGDGRSLREAGYGGILLITINHSYAGFFAYVTFVINQLIFAEKRGLLPVVYFGPWSGDGPNAFHDPARGDNTWDYYFEPVAGWTFAALRAALQAPKSPITRRDVVQLSREELWYLHREDPDSVYNYPYGYYHAADGDVDRWYARQRAKAHQYIERYIKVKPEVLAGVDRYAQEHFTEPVLGVHMRGTDKGGAASSNAHLMQIVPPRVYFPLIDRRLADGGEARIFLATDQRQFVDVVRKRYGHRVLTLDAIRSGSPVNPFQVSDSRNYLKGLEVLRDCLLLSRTRFLLKCTSAVGEYAMYFNPGLACIDVNHLRSRATWRDVAAVTWNRAKSISWEGLGRTDLGSWRTAGVRYLSRNPIRVIVREGIERRRYARSPASRLLAVANDVVVSVRSPAQLPFSTVRYRAMSAHRRRGAREYDPENARSHRYLEIRLNQPGSSPLFVQLARVAEQLHFADAHHLVPVVALDQPDNRYRDPGGGANVWDQYFEPAAGLTPADLDRVPPEQITLLSYRMQQTLDVVASADQPPSGADDDVRAWFERRRERGAHLVRTYMRVRPPLLAVVDAFHAEHLSGADAIGLHLDAPDGGAAGATPAAVDSYLARLDAVLQQRSPARLLLSTDDEAVLGTCTARYGSALRLSPRTRALMHGQGRGRRQGSEAGRDELLDMLLLARTAAVVHAGGHLIDFAAFFNLALETVDLRTAVPADFRGAPAGATA